MTTFPDERTEHAAQVLACAMDGNPADEALSVALHALLIHERYRGRLEAPFGTPRTEAYLKVRQRALDLGEDMKGAWDGWEYPWVEYAGKLLRFIEATYTYFVPDVAA